MLSRRIKCGHCGRFCHDDADSYTPFGGSQDLEPPASVFQCETCIDRDYHYYLGIRRVPSAWIPAQWHYRLAQEIGFARAGSPGAGWSRWFKLGEPLPEGDVWR